MKGRILLIDDNPTDLKVASLALERAGFECHGFTESKEAFSWLDEHDCELVLLDLQMPGLSGYELITRFRGEKKTAKIPIIIVSGKNQVDDVRKAIALGASDYVIKPVDPMVLQDKVGKLTESVGDFVGVDVPTGSFDAACFVSPIRIVGLSEFGMRIEGSSAVAPGQNVEIAGLPKELFGSDRALLRCLSVDAVPGGSTKSMQFTFVGFSEARRQLIRQLCRKFWVAAKGLAA